MENSINAETKVLACEKCGTKLSEDAKFCQACGEPVQLTVCETCGKPIQKNARFCKECKKGVKNK